MLEDSKQTIEIEITDLVTGQSCIITENEIHELDGLSQAARIESIKFGETLVLNTNITDRKFKDIKELCELYISYNSSDLSFGFGAVIVAYIINKAVTADQIIQFIEEKLLLETEMNQSNTEELTLQNLLKEQYLDEFQYDQYIVMGISGYQYYFLTTH